MGVRERYFGAGVQADVFDTLCGELLGEGAGRAVYANLLDPATVIKIETRGRSFQNIMEWELWQSQQYNPSAAKWLAPCVSISPSGIVLVQKRTEPIPKKLLPKDVPAWATDLKQENWSLLNGKPVMHDYGITLLMDKASSRLKKADWSHVF